MQELYEILSFTERLARSAGELILKRSRENTFSVSNKGDVRNLVTSCDLEAEKFIVSKIKERHPSHLILSEESWPSLAAEDLKKPLWIIDPIDGTTNFSRGIPGFCVSIAYADRGRILCGAVDAPAIGERYSACLGGGAKLNGKSIKCSPCASLETAIVSTGFPYKRDDLTQKITRQIEFALEECSGLRRFGAAAIDMCWVGAGKLDAHFEFRLNLWDVAAAALVALETGAILGGFSQLGEKRELTTDMACDRVILSAPGIFESLQKRLVETATN